MPAHARQVVLELRELDLELPLGADGVLGEDVEDQLRPVDDARLSASSSVAAAPGSSSSSTRSASAPHVAERGLQLLELALADVERRSGRSRCWTSSPTGSTPAVARELAHLGELLVGVHARRQHGEDEPALGLGSGRRIGLAWVTGAIMPRGR